VLLQIVLFAKQTLYVYALMHSGVHCTAELFYDRGNHYKFTSLVRELDTANVLMGNRVSVTLH
jgi:hypothetical protein